MPDLVYVEAGHVEWRGKKDIGIKVLVSLDRVLTKEEKHNLGYICSKFIEELVSTNNLNDPIRQQEIKEEKEKILGLFPVPIFYDLIPNGYCSDYCCRDKPWFIVTTTLGRFKIGWRKRVIHLEWTDTIVQKTAADLFLDQVTTQEGKMIHAWSYEKAKEYIDKVLEAGKS